ncbi:MAG: galactokinase, partial [Phycisphaerales bacterium JB038]
MTKRADPGARAREYAVRAPGRVNLIGEHIDYHGLPVLPMALDRAVRIEARPRDDGRVALRNRDPRFPPARFDLGPALAAAAPGAWQNYARAAAHVAHALGARRGVDAVISSDLPAAAGLSSSSALVVAVALALLAANELDVPALELATALARGERFVGTEGGGMDQAVCLAARAGHAMLIRFDPLSCRPVPVPDGWRVWVAHSGVDAEKSGAARDAYNRRRAEGRAALARLAPGVTFAEALAREPAEDWVARAERRLDDVLLRRFRHVVLEAGRVERAVSMLEARDLEGLGALMTRSHASLRDDYEVSHPRLDRLVDAALAAGAAGARLTGAGFGEIGRA